MKKIPSQFQRNHGGDLKVRDEVVPEAAWVAAGEGVATRKWDGTCCLVRGGRLFKRYEVRAHGTPPPAFEPATDADPVTGKQQGWVPVGDGPDDRWHREAWQAAGGDAAPPADGTYELVGPKVQGNPEALAAHRFVPHGAEVLAGVPRDFDGLREYLRTHDVEGIVWWRVPSDPDCDKAKVKARDFGIVRGPG